MKIKKYYHSNRERITVDKTHIEEYLAEVRQKIKNGLFVLATNFKRKDNIELFTDYIIDENIVKETISGLTSENFSEILRNEHKGFEHELLYVFGKTVSFEKRIGKKLTQVPLYIKINNIKYSSVIIISFHEQKYPVKFYFKR